MKKINNFLPLQFTIFRIVFASYLLFHFIYLIPLSADIWTNEGMLNNLNLNFTYLKFPNILYIFNSELEIKIFLILLSILSIFIVFGYYRRISSLFLWFGWACLFHQNNLILNPGIPMVGWLLLALSIIPNGEPLSFSKNKLSDWYMPYYLFVGAWVISGLGYTISGIDKFMSPSWQDGSAIIHLLNNPLARDWILTDFLKQLPIYVLNLQTWFSLLLEISFGFLILFKFTRVFAWLLILILHINILLIVDFADLTFGVLMLHFFIFDSRWFQQKNTKPNIVFFDGKCIFCNSFVNFLINNDIKKVLKFSAIQGEEAKKLNINKDIDYILFYYNDKLYIKSEAVFMIFKQFGGIFILLNIFKIIPNFVSNSIYDIIAKNRYKIFGKSENCMLPNKDYLERFIN